jgi:transposase
MLKLDPRRLVFIDETGVKTNMVRRYGRALRGRRLIGRAPHGHWQTTTFVSALRHDRLTAPMVVDGPMTSDVFVAYVRHVLLPTLEAGDVVIMDNLSSHKARRVRETIESAGAKVAYLPPYSPDLNPIEQAYSKLKWLVRSAAERTVEGLWALLGRLLDRYTPTECRNYLAHCGYNGTPA